MTSHSNLHGKYIKFTTMTVLYIEPTGSVTSLPLVQEHEIINLG
jgi:hypothetical protein